MSPLPVLDIAAFRDDPGSPDAARFVDDLRRACHGPGFCYLTGHGVSPQLEADLLRDSRQFFALPEAERRDLAIVNSAAFRGYTVLGDEQTNGRPDYRDQLDVGPEQAVPADVDDGPAWLRLRGPNQWPPSLPTLQSSVLTWMAEMERLGLDAIRAIAVGLGQVRSYFDDSFLPESDVHLKVIRYPAVDQTDQPGGVGQGGRQGVGRHHDSGLLTLILQDDTGGLQVELDGEFVDAPSVEGAYLMNLGEMLQRATGGYLRATPHRVVSPTNGRQRVSVAFFFNPRFETVFHAVELPAELAAETEAPEVRAEEVRGEPEHDPIHAVFGENNLKIRLRSHPDVAARHYSEVTSNT